MKLIDLLVKELPKRGGWPDGAESVVQDADDTEFYFFTGGPVKNSGKSWWFSGDDNREDNSHWIFFEGKNDIAEDCNSSVVTRAQYESALAASEGWIEWGGGESPVDDDVVVDVKLNGHDGVYTHTASKISWKHVWQAANVIAYRLHKPDINSRANDDRLGQDLNGGLTGPLNSIEECIAYADKERERDLNECIGQDADMPKWNGDWAPPVGIECEVKWTGGKWEKCEVLFVGIEKVVVDMRNREAAMSLCDVKFRPLRTEAENAREAAKHIIADLCRDSASNGHSADLIMEAIAAGKIPGVKLESK